MTRKYQYKSSTTGGDPLIRLGGGQTGILDFLLISREADHIYYKKGGSYEVFTISRWKDSVGFKKKPTISGQTDERFVGYGRLKEFSPEDTILLSAITGIPVEELKEVQKIESENP